MSLLLWLVCSISSHFLHQLQHNKISSSSQTRNAANPFCFKSSVLSLRFHIGQTKFCLDQNTKLQNCSMNSVQHSLKNFSNYIIRFIGPCAPVVVNHVCAREQPSQDQLPSHPHVVFLSVSLNPSQTYVVFVSVNRVRLCNSKAPDNRHGLYM